MVVVPNRTIDIYTRLWCVYEIFIAFMQGTPIELGSTLAILGTSSCAEAHCAKKHDEEKIQKEIKDMYGDAGFNKIDKAIADLTAQIRLSLFKRVCIWGFPIVVCGLAHYNMWDPDDCRLEFQGLTLGLLLSVMGLVFSYYRVSRTNQGVIPARILCQLALVQFVLWVIFTISCFVTRPLKTECDGTFRSHNSTKLFLGFIYGFSKTMKVGIGAATAISILCLLYTYFIPKSRAFSKKWWEDALLVLSMVLYCFLRSQTSNKRIPRSAWTDFSQAYPETFAVVTEFLACYGFPLTGIWNSSMYWGLKVDWDDFWQKGRTEKDSSRRMHRQDEKMQSQARCCWSASLGNESSGDDDSSRPSEQSKLR
jgi:hypothetical protein